MRLSAPRALLAPALLIALAFGVAHALGLREETRFLSGTPANVGAGLLYALLYFAFVLVAPVLALAAAIHAALDRLARRRDPVV